MAKFVPQPELSLNDQMQIRREKLAALQAEGCLLYTSDAADEL